MSGLHINVFDGLVRFDHLKIYEAKSNSVFLELGASPLILFNLLSKEFFGLVTIALIIASPIAWLAMDNWLQDYSNRIDISWWIFIFAGATTILITLVTISFQSIKAATANPVKSLRME
jgi:putative ABC transport system permease protein